MILAEIMAAPKRIICYLRNRQNSGCI